MKVDDPTYPLVIHRINRHGDDQIFRGDTDSRYLAESCYELNLGLFETDAGYISWVMVLYIHFNGERMVLRSDESEEGKGILNLKEYLRETNE